MRMVLVVVLLAIVGLMLVAGPPVRIRHDPDRRPSPRPGAISVEEAIRLVLERSQEAALAQHRAQS